MVTALWYTILRLDKNGKRKVLEWKQGSLGYGRALLEKNLRLKWDEPQVEWSSRKPGIFGNLREKNEHFYFLVDLPKAARPHFRCIYVNV